MAERNERQMFEGRRYDGNDRRASYRPARQKDVKSAKNKVGGRKAFIFIALLITAFLIVAFIYPQWMPFDLSI